MKIVILDGDTISPGVWKYDAFEKFGEVIGYPKTPRELAAERIGDAEFVCTDSTIIDRETIDRCPNLKWIGVIATGYDRVDVEYAKRKGIVVCNAPAYAAQVVSQHAFALLFYLCHHLKKYSEVVQDGSWHVSSDFLFWDYPIKELHGKTMGIFGFGEIAKHSAKIAEAFGLDVLISTNHPDESFKTQKINFAASKDMVFERADIISLHCPLRSDTKEMIDRHSIEKMKDGVIIINTARGALINENDLVDAMKRGKVAAVGLDVLSEEPPVKKNPLVGMKNCIVTPHLAWNSNEARKRLVEITINNLEGFLDGNIINRVN